MVFSDDTANQNFLRKQPKPAISNGGKSYLELSKGKQSVAGGTEATLAKFWKAAEWKNGTEAA